MNRKQTRDDETLDKLIEVFEAELKTNDLPDIDRYAAQCPEAHREELVGVLNLMVLAKRLRETATSPKAAVEKTLERGEEERRARPTTHRDVLSQAAIRTSN